MKILGVPVVSTCIVLLASCSASWTRDQPNPAGEKSPPQPNVVLLYGDDVGFGDVGCNGAKLIPTPNIDRLAEAGLRFTDAHCTAATCTPSRFSLMTGIHGFRRGIRVLPPDAPLTIPVDALTLPDVFQKAGYETAIVGKWHLGLGKKDTSVDWNGEVRPGPLELGFDRSFILPSTNDRVPCVYLDGHRVWNLDPTDPLFVGRKPEGVECTTYPNGRDTPEAMTYYGSTQGHNNSVINGIGRIGTMHGGSHAVWDDETMADVFVDRAVRWIEERPKSSPFFLFFSSQDIHVPRTPHPRFRGATDLGYRGDAMVALDWAVGEILRALEENGLAENTLVIFTSDNGPVYDDGYRDGTVVHTSREEVDQGHDGSGPFRGGKYQIYEGGTRVPFIVRWPGVVPPGETSPALVSQIDLLASFAEMFGVELGSREAIDSRDTLDAFLGEDRIGLPFMIEEAGVCALREGAWKLVQRKERVELYDLATDVGERSDLAESRAERARTMAGRLQNLRTDSAGIRAAAPH